VQLRSRYRDLGLGARAHTHPPGAGSREQGAPPPNPVQGSSYKVQWHPPARGVRACGLEGLRGRVPLRATAPHHVILSEERASRRATTRRIPSSRSDAAIGSSLRRFRGILRPCDSLNDGGRIVGPSPWSRAPNPLFNIPRVSPSNPCYGKQHSTFTENSPTHLIVTLCRRSLVPLWQSGMITHHVRTAGPGPLY
jgi:hypothetical protein